MYFFTPKHNVLQHKLLGLLAQKIAVVNDPAGSLIVENIDTTTKEIKKQLKIMEADFLALVTGPSNNDELLLDTQDRDELIFITAKGEEAYYEKKYLRAGRQQVLNQVNDLTKIIIPLIAIILSIVSFYISMTDRVYNRRTIEKLKAEILLLQTKPVKLRP